ncbi:hypothetical protein B5X24_HaOG216685 [Helicoverpa armigera]|nr:hypothetical protein B5X24_HaOG216685 [Helicoverpa armigera]
MPVNLTVNTFVQCHKLLYSALVRTKLEANSSLWNPHEAKRECDQIETMLICEGLTEAPDILNELIRLYTPNNYLRRRGIVCSTCLRVEPQPALRLPYRAC